MKRLLLLFLLAGCPDDGPANPTKLWLYLIDGDETRVQLVPFEPDPF